MKISKQIYEKIKYAYEEEFSIKTACIIAEDLLNNILDNKIATMNESEQETITYAEENELDY